MNSRNRGFLPVINSKRKIFDDFICEPHFFIPQRGTIYSAGYDFKSPLSFTILPGNSFKVYTNIKAYMLNDEHLEIHIRSSIAIKKNLRLKNIVGQIDADYFENLSNDGNIIICLYNEGDEVVFICKGERIVQGIFKKYLIVDDDEPVNNIRVGGIGSTGK